MTDKKKISKRIPPKEKRIKYINAYVESGYNKTAANLAVNPQRTYASAHQNSTRDHVALMTIDDLTPADIPLDQITPQVIINRVDRLSIHAPDDGNKLQALKLLGQWRKLWSDTTNNTLISVDIHAQVADAIRDAIAQGITPQQLTTFTSDNKDYVNLKDDEKSSTVIVDKV